MKILNKMKFIALLVSISLAVFTLAFTTPAYAAASPSLGAADSFSVLAAKSATSANMTKLSGDLGLSTGLEDSRTGPWTVEGIEYFGPSSQAFNARADALGAFNNLAGQGSNGMWSLAPSPVPGVWTADSSAVFDGTLTLSGGYDDVWVFQITSDFTFSGSVSLTGNAQPCHVFWQISRDATINPGSTFVGTLIAGNDVVVKSGATVNGRILSLDGALTTDANTITGPTCQAATPTPTPTEVQAAPSNPGGPGDGRSDGRNDGLSSCPSCTAAPPTSTSTGGSVLGASTTTLAATGSSDQVMRIMMGAVAALVVFLLGHALLRANETS